MVLDPGVSAVSDGRRLFALLANCVYQFRGSCICHCIVIDCRKVELRWDWLRCVMFIPSLVKICRLIQRLTLALARITVMTQVFNRLRRESGPINVKQFPLINGKCGSIDASQVCAQLGRNTYK